MPVGSGKIPQVNLIKGIRLGVTQANIKYPNKSDLVVIEIADGASVAATFTQNRFCAAPVTLAKKHLKSSACRYLIINTGYANVGLGELGDQTALACCEALARAGNVSVESVLPFSTGVIGEALPLDPVLAGIPACLEDLAADNWVAAATGIMTTDTRPKVASKTYEFQGETFSITGMSKGAGMIKPNMATMLAYVATDLKVGDELLNEALANAVRYSFNCITVDGDTSTNDACVAIATGQSSLAVHHSDDELYRVFSQALDDIALELAHAIIKDGEGVSKFVEVCVNGGATYEDSKTVAYTVAHSPLVKTALFASDPNWGRILGAVGRAEIDNLNVDRVGITLGDVPIVENGVVAPSYSESLGARVMSEESIVITIDLGSGTSVATVWTTDFSYDYVKINAEYRS